MSLSAFAEENAHDLLAPPTSGLHSGKEVGDNEMEDGALSKCCFIRTSSFRKTMRRKKSERNKKSDQGRHIVLSLLEELLESVVEKPSARTSVGDGTDAGSINRYFPTSPTIHQASPELQLSQMMRSSTPCRASQGSLCGTIFSAESDLGRLGKPGAHNNTVLDTSVSSDGGSFAGDVFRVLDEKLGGEGLALSSKKKYREDEDVKPQAGGAPMKPPLMYHGSGKERKLESPRRGDRICLISPAPFRGTAFKGEEIPKAEDGVENEILRENLMNGSYFTGRCSTEIILTTNTVLNIQRNDLVIPSVLMTWLSNMLRQGELKLPKEVVDKVAMAVGNSFFRLGLIASLGESEKAGDSLLKVNRCFLLFSICLVHLH